MGTFHRFTLRLLPISLAAPSTLRVPAKSIIRPERPIRSPLFVTRRPSSSSTAARAGWFLGLNQKKKTSLPEIVKAGDPVLHEPAREIDPKEIGSEKIQKIVDDMINVMRMAPGVGLAAPQIGIPLRIIVLEDTEEYISYARKEETEAQDRRPFDILV